MIPDPILTLSAVCAAMSLAGLYLVARLRRLRHDLDMVVRVVEHQSRSIGSTCVAQDHLRDDLTDLRAEYLAQARALDAHDDRLVALEETP